jgi:transposase
MPRKLSLQPHLSPSELKVHYFESADPVESRRFHLLWLAAQKYTLVDAAQTVGINYDYAYEIVQRYNQQGTDGLKNGRKSRRPPRPNTLLNAQQRRQLAHRLQSPPEDGGLWTGPKVARWVEQVTGKPKIWNQRGWDYLKRLRYSWQRPRPYHDQADGEAQAAFKKTSPIESQSQAAVSRGGD